MAVHPAIRTILAAIPEQRLPGESADDRICEGARFHSPTPLRMYRVTVGEREVWLCGSCKDNLAVLLLLEEKGRDDLPWRRGFGNQLRALVREDADG